MRKEAIWITKDNINVIREIMPVDQGAEVYPGCTYIRGIGWDITIYPKTGRAAYCEGGPSNWGNIRNVTNAFGQVVDGRIEFDDPAVNPAIISLLS